MGRMGTTGKQKTEENLSENIDYPHTITETRDTCNIPNSKSKDQTRYFQARTGKVQPRRRPPKVAWQGLLQGEGAGAQKGSAGREKGRQRNPQTCGQTLMSSDLTNNNNSHWGGGGS